MARGFLYLAGVMDWFARRILAWRLSITLGADFCIDAVEEALRLYGRPEIFNSDQGSQFTSDAFTDILITKGIAISMDGKGSWRDNVFVERFWRTLKYEEVYLKAYESVAEARSSIHRNTHLSMLLRRIDFVDWDQVPWGTLQPAERVQRSFSLSSPRAQHD